MDLCVFFVNTCQNKRTSLRMSFCFGFRRPESGFTLGISMLGVGKAAPAQFPACGRKFTRHSARGPEGPFYLFPLPASFSSAQNTSSRTAYRSRRLFYKSHRSLIPSLLLSKPDPLRWAPVWFAALRAALFWISASFSSTHAKTKGHPFGCPFVLGSAAQRAASPLGFQCSGSAKPPLRNSRPAAGNLRATRRAAQKGRFTSFDHLHLFRQHRT